MEGVITALLVVLISGFFTVSVVGIATYASRRS
ncbi:hypothetical protein QIO57_gp3 [ssRNA phage SRR5466369_2]|uniref:Uncharacterized protein n=1 Tax=ssRNA phage SRR5466369_2 TaxID=2786405 RepID=A0A8S5L127_9VIRU|nr:hypothetical protein QIO57_gp3 [ssRNA phage SRR5466369_2]DAD50810.1 TPA_asm: hypothetical protein [ssRNA phage SRR5466369_2]